MTTSSRSLGREATAIALLAVVTCGTVPREALADPPIVITEAPIERGAPISVALTSVSDPSLAELGHEVDAALTDAARDLGFRVAGNHAAPGMGPDAASEVHATLTVAPTGMIDLRLARLAPRPVGDAPPRWVEKRVLRGDVTIEAVVLLRALLRGASAGASPDRGAGLTPPARPIDRVGGRATLMASAGVLGGVVGFSIQSASGSEDARLLVPLTLVGAGIGVGAAYLASGEWDITPADAWFFTAGATWGTVAGHLVFQGRFAADRESQDRWVFGLVGGGLGATLATVGLTLHPMTDAGALLANAGGAGGLAIGAVVELAVNARTSGHPPHASNESVPCAGMGYGAALGWLAAATVAVNLRPRWLDRPLARTPFVGVIGRGGDRNASGILGLGYGGSLVGLPGPFHL